MTDDRMTTAITDGRMTDDRMTDGEMPDGRMTDANTAEYCPDH